MKHDWVLSEVYPRSANSCMFPGKYDLVPYNVFAERIFFGFVVNRRRNSKSVLAERRFWWGLSHILKGYLVGM